MTQDDIDRMNQLAHERNKKLQAHASKFLVGFVILMITIVLINKYFETPIISLNKNTEAFQSNISAVPVDAHILFKDYENNEVRADQRYKGKLIRFSGQIGAIGKDFTDKAYIELNMGNYGGDFIYCSFNDLSKIASLNKGETIAIEGICTGKIFSEVTVDNCSIQ